MNQNKRMRLRYTNEQGISVLLGDDAPFIFLSQTGIDGLNANIISVKSPFQRGITSLGTNIDDRILTLNAALISENMEEQEELRRVLLRAFSPVRKGRLEIFTNKANKCFFNTEVISAPIFKDDDYSDFQNILFFQVTISAPGAFVSDLHDTVFELSEVVPLLEFPFEVEVGNKFEVGTLNFGGVKYYNDSDGEAPVIIEILGPVMTPKITNVTTGEYIQVHTPLLAGEKMIINTSFANKRVTIINESGEERNAFHYIDLGSTFFRLIQGENHIKFDAEAGNDTAKIYVYFKRLWVGI